MSRFDALIRQATARLSPDPELQLEVAHELRTHLEDSAAEFRAAGFGEDESAAKAAEAFGNPEEVAQKLLAANRKRMRVRRITRTAAGVTLAPVAAAVAISVGWSALTSLLIAVGLVSNLGWFKETGFGESFSTAAYNRTFHAYQDAIDGLPPAQRMLFKGGSTANFNQTDPYGTAKALAERHPEDPVFAANYAVLAIGHFKVGQWGESRQQWSPDGLARTLDILDRCQRAEPDNGYYPLLRGQVLMGAGAEELYDTSDDSRMVAYTDARGEERTNFVSTLRMVDRGMFERGIASLHEAAGKPYVRSHAAELAQRRLAALPGPSRLTNEFVRIEFARNVYEPFAGYYLHAITCAGGFATDLAADGKLQRAQSILDDEAKAIRLVASGARFANEVLIAAQMRGELTTETVVIDRLLGHKDEAQAARKEYEAELREWRALRVRRWGPLEKQREHAGVLEEAVWSDPRLVLDPQRSAAGRAIDYSVTDQIALAVLAVLLAIAALPLLRRTQARPGRPAKVPVFIGWRRLLRVVLIGAGVPLVLYGIYAYSTAFNARSYGLLYTHSRLPVQYLALVAIIAGLLRLLTNRAARQRAAELGIAVPPAEREWVIVQFVVAAILAAATAAYLAAWRPADPDADPDRLSGRGVWELAMIFLLGTYALVSLLSAGAAPLFEKSADSGGFLRKLWARFPAWPLYAGLMAAVTLSLWLTWAGLVAGRRGTITLLLLSAAIAVAGVLALWILMRLFETARPDRQAEQAADHLVEWRAAPYTFAAAALAIVLVGFPLLSHVERTALRQFDQRLRLWDLDHGPYAEVQAQLSAPARLPTSQPALPG